MKLSTDEQKILDFLEAERKRISAEIRRLKKRGYNKEYYTPRKNTKSIVYTIFGKSYRELTTDEKRQYNAIRQRETRQKKTK